MKLSVTLENAGLLLTYAQLNCHFLVQHFRGKTYDVYVMNAPILLQQFLRCLSERGTFVSICLTYILEIKDQLFFMVTKENSMQQISVQLQGCFYKIAKMKPHHNG